MHRTIQSHQLGAAPTCGLTGQSFEHNGRGLVGRIIRSAATLYIAAHMLVVARLRSRGDGPAHRWPRRRFAADDPS